VLDAALMAQKGPICRLTSGNAGVTTWVDDVKAAASLRSPARDAVVAIMADTRRPGRAQNVVIARTCLPIVDDLNCSALKGPVIVTGSDPYRLDRDHDGVGCER
jgi:hypothetical protein